MLRGPGFVTKHISERSHLLRQLHQCPRLGQSLPLLPQHQRTSHRPQGHAKSSSPSSTFRDLPDELLLLLDSMTDYTNIGLAPSFTQSSTLKSLCLNEERVRHLSVDLANTHLPERSLKFLSLSSALGTRLKQNAYECTAHEYASAKRWKDVLAVVSLGILQSKTSTLRLLNWRTRALIEEEQYSDLTAILHDFSKFKLTPNRRTYHLLLSGHVKNHDLHRAKECLQQMYAVNCPPDASTYALLATIFRPFGYDMQIYTQAIEAIPKLNSGEFSTNVLNSLLQIHLDSCNPSEDTLDLISMFDLPSLKSAVASSLSIEIAPKDADAVEERSVISLPHDRPLVKPNSETFCILLNNAASRKDVAAAKLYLEIMSATNVEPTAATITSLLHVLYATSHDAAATQLLSDVCGPQTSDMFQRLSDSQAKLPLPISVSGILPDTKMFNAFLKANLNSKGLAQWALILRIMRAHGLEPNDSTVNILISYLEKVEHARPRELLHLLQTFSSIGLKLGGHHFHGVIRSSINREKRKIRGIGWKSQAFRLSQPNPPPLMIKDFSQISEHLDPLAGFQLATHRRHGALAQPLIRQLSERGVRSDAALFALRIRYDGVVKGDLDSARNMFHALLSRGIRPTAYHFAALMEGHTYAGDILGAEEVMQAAVESGIAPNVVMFTILISGHARKGKPYLALRTFQRMLSLGIKPDVPSIDAVANAFFAAGARAMARRVLLSLWPYISPCPPELLGAPLRDLSRRFRELHKANAYSSEPFPKSQRTMVRRRTARLIRQWLALDGSRRGRSH